MERIWTTNANRNGSKESKNIGLICNERNSKAKYHNFIPMKLVKRMVFDL